MLLLLCTSIYALICFIKRKRQKLIVGATIAIIYYMLSAVSDIPALISHAFLLSVAENLALLTFVAWMAKSNFADKGEKNE